MRCHHLTGEIHLHSLSNHVVTLHLLHNYLCTCSFSEFIIIPLIKVAQNSEGTRQHSHPYMCLLKKLRMNEWVPMTIPEKPSSSAACSCLQDDAPAVCIKPSKAPFVHHNIKNNYDFFFWWYNQCFKLSMQISFDVLVCYFL